MDAGRARPSNAGSEAARDAILLDIRLPGLSGLEVLQRVRAMPARLPVIIGMSVAWESTEREALSLGASAFLAKPFRASVA